MNRRNFVKIAGALGAATALPRFARAAAKPPRYKMGLQLYSVRDAMVANPAATLAALTAMGYQDFETAGFDIDAGTFYGRSPQEFKTILDELGITANSGHFWLFPYLNRPVDELRRAVDSCIAGALAVGTRYITWPWLAPEQRTLDSYKLLSERLNVIGEQVAAAGLKLAYHNHGFEFDDHSGQNGFDIIVAETDPQKVKLQMDLYWVIHSSTRSPQQLVSEQPGRYVMWHIKDMDKVSGDYTELGNGSIDYSKVLPDAATSGLEHYYVEQGGNYTHDAMQSAATSADYLIKHLRHHL